MKSEKVVINGIRAEQVMLDLAPADPVTEKKTPKQSKDKRLKVRLLDDYYDHINDCSFCYGDILPVEVQMNSDYYHFWNGNKLHVIPENICEVL